MLALFAGVSSMNRYRSACPLDCWDACAFIVEIDSEGKIEIKGDPDHPVTQGFVCQKARKLVERNSASNRLDTPLLRKNGELVPVSWDEALDTWVSKIRKAIDTGGPRSILWYHDYGSGGMLKNLEARFFNLLGGVTRPRGSLCWAAGIAAQEADFGAVLSHPPEDIFNAGAIVVWGKNPALTSIHFQRQLFLAKKQGIPIVVIDPLVTETAAMADFHLQPFPGSDGWLALGLAAVLVCPPSEFIRTRTNNYPEYKELLAQADLETVSQKTGIAGEDIVKLAETIATSKPVHFNLGYGLQRYNDSGNTIRHIDALAAIAGSIGVKGGGVNYANTFWDDILDYEALTLKGEHHTFPKSELGLFLEEREDIQIMVVSRANPLVQAPDLNKVRAGFNKVPFKVVLELVMTDTAREADLVLPCTSFLEEENVYMSNMWHTTINYAKPVLPAYGKSRPEGEIYQELSQRLGLDGFPKRSAREWLETVLASAEVNGITLDKLEHGSLGPEPQPYLPWSEGDFLTNSGKFEFTIELPEEPDPPQDGFLLLSPHRGGNMHSQFFTESPEHVLHFSSETAPQVQEGDRVKIQSDHGELTVRIKISDKIPSGVGVLYQGASPGGKPVNDLTSPEPTKMGDGAAYNQCYCRIKI